MNIEELRSYPQDIDSLDTEDKKWNYRNISRGINEGKYIETETIVI